MKKIIFFLLSVLILTSCSIEKRRYQKGFYVKRSHQKDHKPRMTAEHEKKRSTADESPQEVRTGDKRMEASAVEMPPVQISKSSVPPDTCDVLMFQDGSEIRAKVMEVNPTDIKYKRCDNYNGPMYVSRKSDLFMIKYANGSREVIKTEPPPAPQGQSLPNYNKRDYTKPRINHPRAGLALGLGAASVAAAFITLLAAGSMIIPPFIIIPLLLLAIGAVVVSSNVLNQIRDQPEVYKGKGMAVPGLVMGIVMLSLYALTAGFIILFFLI